MTMRMIKNILGCLLLTAVLSAESIANAAPSGRIGVRDIYSKYSVCENAESVEIGRLLINLARFAVSVSDEECTSDTDMAIRTLSNLKKIQVLSLEECSSEDRRSFCKDVVECDMDGYMVLTEVKDGNDKMCILVAGSEDVFTEMVILSYGEDPAYIRLKGRFTTDEVKMFINEMQ